MKSLRFSYIAGDRIFTPFSLEYTEIDISSDLLASVGTLFPIKSTFFHQKNPNILSVSLLPDAPYGPDIDTLREFLFPDFYKALSELGEFFGLHKISLISPDPGLKNHVIEWSPHMNERHEAGIVLSLFEFYQLYTAAIQERYLESVLLSIFIDEQTIFCIQIPEGISLKNVLLLLQTEYYLDIDSESTLFHPLLRKMLDPERETTGHGTSLIMFPHSGYTMASADKMFLEFPYFHQTIGIRKGKIVEKKAMPCNHCLACSTYCPSALFPNFLYHKSLKGKKDATVALNIYACIQCGKCNFVCPANLPLCETITQTIQELRTG